MKLWAIEITTYPSKCSQVMARYGAPEVWQKRATADRIAKQFNLDPGIPGGPRQKARVVSCRVHLSL